MTEFDYEEINMLKSFHLHIWIFFQRRESWNGFWKSRKGWSSKAKNNGACTISSVHRKNIKKKQIIFDNQVKEQDTDILKIIRKTICSIVTERKEICSIVAERKEISSDTNFLEEPDDGETVRIEKKIRSFLRVIKIVSMFRWIVTFATMMRKVKTKQFRLRKNVNR